jgi:ribosomal protein S3
MAGVSAVEVGRAAGQLRTSIRAARPILVAGHRGAEADRLCGELEELTGRRVRLELWEVPGSQEGPGSEGPGVRAEDRSRHPYPLAPRS